MPQEIQYGPDFARIGPTAFDVLRKAFDGRELPEPGPAPDAPDLEYMIYACPDCGGEYSRSECILLDGESRAACPCLCGGYAYPIYPTA